MTERFNLLVVHPVDYVGYAPFLGAARLSIWVAPTGVRSAPRVESVPARRNEHHCRATSLCG